LKLVRGDEESNSSIGDSVMGGMFMLRVESPAHFALPSSNAGWPSSHNATQKVQEFLVALEFESRLITNPSFLMSASDHDHYNEVSITPNHNVFSIYKILTELHIRNLTILSMKSILSKAKSLKRNKTKVAKSLWMTTKKEVLYCKQIYS